MKKENGNRIISVKAREILNSRGNFTVEVELKTNQGVFCASVPSGASKSKYEAKEIKTPEAVKNIQEVIGPKIKGMEVIEQKRIDDLIIELDKTKNKSELGANAILAVSMAVCRAGAVAAKIPLYKHIAKMVETRPSPVLPVPCFNIINGGVHAGNNLGIQEFMIVPQEKKFSKNLKKAVEIYHNLKEILKKRFGRSAVNLGDEGGFAPPLSFTEQALDLIDRSVKKSENGKDVKIGLDCAASEFFKNENYKLDKVVFTREGLIKFYQNIVRKYPILFLEDPFSQDDWQGWREISSKFKVQNSKLLIIGDDLLATNPYRVKQARKKDACNGMILKINQIGTVSEAIESAKLAKSYNWKIIVSHRSGETNDDFISDLAVGISADFIKAGAPARGERVAKYNRLLKIEEELR